MMSLSVTYSHASGGHPQVCVWMLVHVSGEMFLTYGRCSCHVLQITIVEEKRSATRADGINGGCTGCMPTKSFQGTLVLPQWGTRLLFYLSNVYIPAAVGCRTLPLCCGCSCLSPWLQLL